MSMERERERLSYRSLCSRATLQNKQEGCFLELVANLAPRVNLRAFSQCSSDLERIRFCGERCWDFMGAELVFRGYSSQHWEGVFRSYVIERKDETEGVRRRKEGNDAFEKGDLELALLAYSQGVIRTPEGEHLSLVLANRSALLFRMGEWKLCLADIQMALHLNYPLDRRHILYERLSAAYLHLHDLQESKMSYQLALDFAAKHNNSDPKFLKKLVNLKRKFGKWREAVPKVLTEETRPSFPRSQVFPVASVRFGLECTVKEGRSGIALEEIGAGEEVLAEPPFASCLLPERNGTHCHHCLRSLRAPVPCETCAHVAFCSVVCRERGRTYHQHECRVLLLLIGSGMSVLPLLALRMLTQQPVHKVLQEAESLGVPSAGVVLNEAGQYEGSCYRAVYHLSGQEEARDAVDFLERTLMALFLLKCLRLVGYSGVNLFLHPHPTEEELWLGSLLLRNLQVLQFNAYEITETLLPPTAPFSKLRTFQLGLGIYSTAAFFNHSCSPNVSRYFTGTTLHVVATQRIPKGAPITDNYGPIFTKMKKEERQLKLEGRYWFRCACVACAGEECLWSLLEDIPQPHCTETGTKPSDQSILDKAFALMEAGGAEEAKGHLLQLINTTKPLLGHGEQKTLNANHFLAQEALRRILSTTGLTSMQESSSCANLK